MCGNYGLSTESQTPYLTHEVCPIQVSAPPPLPKPHGFSQYSSPLTPQFSAEAMNLFHNERQNSKMSSQTYLNSEWLYTPLTPQDFQLEQ